MKRSISYRAVLSALLVLVAVSGLARGGWVTEIEIKSEIRPDGESDFSVRFLPEMTRAYDQIEFVCIYRQKFPWVNARGKKYIKVHEPVSFTYRRKAVRFVNDLDAHVSFRVPVSRARLDKMYGPKVFRPGHPVTVDRIKITAQAGGEVIWEFELPAEGTHDIEALMAKSKTVEKKEEVIEDLK